jgi:cytidylate kinase
MGFTVAIDGPAASGKGTIGRAVAKFFGYLHLDTGLIYRAVAYLAADQGQGVIDIPNAIEIAKNFKPSYLELENLRTTEAAINASGIATIPEIREELVNFQRAFAQKNPGVVIDGRDIGTVICPKAEVKLFVTASLNARVRRRYEELFRIDETTQIDKIREDLKARDDRDKKRNVAPMKISRDAHLIDTTELSIEASIARAISIIDERRLNS